MLNIHGSDYGLGGDLSEDEITVIRGALDLSHKTATSCMTPLDKVLPDMAITQRFSVKQIRGKLLFRAWKQIDAPRDEYCESASLCLLTGLLPLERHIRVQVFMLSADALVDEALLLSILESGHSRVPVHKPGSRWPRSH